MFLKTTLQYLTDFKRKNIYRRFIPKNKIGAELAKYIEDSIRNNLSFYSFLAEGILGLVFRDLYGYKLAKGVIDVTDTLVDSHTGVDACMYNVEKNVIVLGEAKFYESLDAGFDKIIDDFVNNDYNIIGNNLSKKSIKISDQDYLLMYLKYNKYIEMTCCGFIIKYLRNGVLYEKVYDVLQNNDQDIHISSFCPVVNDLIQKQFPMLLDNQNNFEYPAVLAAKDIRKKYGSEVGIFLLCECPGKLTLGKYPYGNNDSEIDHCLSIVDVFPLINMLRSDNLGEIKLNESGMKLNATGLGKRIDDHILSVAGLVKVRKALELCEFGLLKDVKYLSLSACFNGCIGGQFLWGNPFNGRVNMKNLLQYANVETKEYSIEDIQRQQTYTHSDQINMIQKLKRFNKVNEIFDKLPGFDCGACGYPSCRGLAEAIVDENQSINDCNIIRKREQYAG